MASEEWRTGPPTVPTPSIPNLHHTHVSDVSTLSLWLQAWSPGPCSHQLDMSLYSACVSWTILTPSCDNSDIHGIQVDASTSSLAKGPSSSSHHASDLPPATTLSNEPIPENRCSVTIPPPSKSKPCQKFPQEINAFPWSIFDRLNQV